MTESTKIEGTTPGPAPRAVDHRFVMVDALRGVAALWVVLFHAYEGHHIPRLAERLPSAVLAVIANGNLGVAIFFVLSGFVIAHSVSRHTVDARFMGRFVLRRAVRLDIPYWCSLLLVVALAYLSSRVVAGKVFDPPTVAAVAAHLVYLQDLLGYKPLATVYWTLCFEFQFYLIFVLLMAFVKRSPDGHLNRRRLMVVFIPCAVLAACWPVGAQPFPLPRGLFLSLWYGFLLGALAYWAQLRVLPGGLFLAYAAVVGAGGGAASNAFAVVCAVTSVLLFVAGRLNRLTVWLRFRWLLFLGLISYSLYLTHNPVTGAFYNVAHRLWSGGAAEAFWLPVMVLVNVGFSALFWLLFERTALTLSHKISLRRPRA